MFESAVTAAEMSSPFIGVGMVGVGYWGPNLARNLFQNERVKLKYICDTNTSRLGAVSARFPETTATNRFSDLLNDDEVHAVVLAVPAESHYHLARLALEAGKHVLVEKPLTLTSGESICLIERAEKRGLVLMVGHTFLYNSVVGHVKRMSDKGELGDIFYINSRRVNLGRQQHDINAFWSIAPHDVSIMNYWLGGYPVAVQATGSACLSADVEDVVFATLYYSRNRIAHIHVSWVDPSKERRISVVGSKRMLIYDEMDPEGRLRIYDQGAEPGQRPDRFFGDYQTKLRAGDITIPRIDYVEPLAAEIDHFLDCIANRETPRSDGINGLEVVLVCEAVEESLHRGGVRVEIPSMAKILDQSSPGESSSI